MAGRLVSLGVKVQQVGGHLTGKVDPPFVVNLGKARPIGLHSRNPLSQASRQLRDLSAIGQWGGVLFIVLRRN
jgi:hypothetical protein